MQQQAEFSRVLQRVVPGSVASADCKPSMAMPLRTWHEDTKCVPIAVVDEVFPNKLVDEQVLIAQALLCCADLRNGGSERAKSLRFVQQRTSCG